MGRVRVSSLASKRASGLPLRFWRLVFFALVMAAMAGCGSPETVREQGDRETAQNRTVNRTTVVERTVFRTVVEKPEEADAVMGERVTLGGVAFQVFGHRSESTVYYVSGPGNSFESRSSARGEYLAVDYFARNGSGEEATLLPEATLTDSEGETYGVDREIAPPTENSGGLTVGNDEFLSSTLFFDLPDGANPETVALSFGGDEATVSLTNRNPAGLEPLNYLSVYTLWFNQRAYDDIYALFDPSSTRGISEHRWVSYFEPLWGEWYLSLDRVNFDPALSDETRSFSLMSRTFYETDGTVTESPVEQELVKSADEWELVMRQDQVDDILGASNYVPEPTTPEEQEKTEYTLPEPEETTSTPPTKQYDPPDPDPDPAPDPNRPGNTPNYPSDGWTPGSEDKDCEDFPGGVTVSPDDPYDLDGDGDGIACEPPPY